MKNEKQIKTKKGWGGGGVLVSHATESKCCVIMFVPVVVEGTH